MGPSRGRLGILGRWLFTAQPTSAAIDITHRCNLQCRHCYWWKEHHPVELGDGAMTALFKTLRARGLSAALLYGGEPTLRPAMVRAADSIFDALLVFTNGTNGLPPLHRGQYILSLEGTREINDAIRGKGTYDRALESILGASRPPIVHVTLSRLNEVGIEAFVETMLTLPVKGIGFSFYTPSRGREEASLWIPFAERDRIGARLLALRRAHGVRVGFTEAMARQLSVEGAFHAWNRRSLCPVTRRVLCFRSDGSPKKCTYGDEADCSRCGCAAVVVYRAAFHPPEVRSLFLILGLVFPGLGARRRRR